MVDFGGTLTSITSGAKEVGFIGVGIVAWFGLIMLFGVIAGGITWWWMRKKKYANKIVDQPTGMQRYSYLPPLLQR